MNNCNGPIIENSKINKKKCMQAVYSSRRDKIISLIKNDVIC